MHSAKKEAEQIRQDALDNRNWQERMSNTSIQRRVEDMRKAGINPLLAVSNASAGASTPQGGFSSAQSNTPAMISSISSAFLASKQAKVAEAEANKINAETENISNENSIFSLKARKAQLENFLIESNLVNNRVYADLMRAQTENERVQIIYNRAKKLKLDIDIEQAKKIDKLIQYDIEDETNTPFGRRREMQWNRLRDVVDWFVPWAESSGGNKKGGIVINNIRD